ncbi:unnamed protein product [Amoebophrya sp. A120]|nr:unnamed protein product [Amoebophrya sp. A120]|eukprot:GSA120T00025478001.1
MLVPRRKSNAGVVAETSSSTSASRSSFSGSTSSSSSSTQEINNEFLYRQFRYSVGVPEGGDELIPEKALPQKANLDLLNFIDFEKGCYTGQELTIRTHHRGMVRRRLVIVKQSFPSDAALELAESSEGPTESKNPDGSARLSLKDFFVEHDKRTDAAARTNLFELAAQQHAEIKSQDKRGGVVQAKAGEMVSACSSSSIGFASITALDGKAPLNSVEEARENFLEQQKTRTFFTTVVNTASTSPACSEQEAGAGDKTNLPAPGAPIFLQIFTPPYFFPHKE